MQKHRRQLHEFENEFNKTNVVQIMKPEVRLIKKLKSLQMTQFNKTEKKSFSSFNLIYFNLFQ